MVGAGIVGNAGWSPTGVAFSNFVKEIKVYDFKEDLVRTIIPNEEYFSERNSSIKQENKEITRFFIISCILKANFLGIDKVKEKYDIQINKRKESLKIGYQEGCAGSIFSSANLKRQAGKSLGKMIREYPEIRANYNGATFSEFGSHFFVTGDNTTDKDVAKLLNHTLIKLRKLYNITPKLEMLILDYDGEIGLDKFLERYLEN